MYDYNFASNFTFLLIWQILESTNHATNILLTQNVFEKAHNYKQLIAIYFRLVLINELSRFMKASLLRDILNGKIQFFGFTLRDIDVLKNAWSQKTIYLLDLLMSLTLR